MEVTEPEAASPVADRNGVAVQHRYLFVLEAGFEIWALVDALIHFPPNPTNKISAFYILSNLYVIVILG